MTSVLIVVSNKVVENKWLLYSCIVEIIAISWQMSTNSG